MIRTVNDLRRALDAPGSVDTDSFADLLLGILVAMDMPDGVKNHRQDRYRQAKERADVEAYMPTKPINLRWVARLVEEQWPRDDDEHLREDDQA